MSTQVYFKVDLAEKKRLILHHDYWHNCLGKCEVTVPSNGNLGKRRLPNPEGMHSCKMLENHFARYRTLSFAKILQVGTNNMTTESIC